MMKRLATTDGVVSILYDMNVRIVQTDLCGVARGLSRKHHDGYLVLLDQSLSFDCLLHTLKHELCHIILGHLDDDVKTDEEKENEVKMVLLCQTNEIKEAHYE